MMTHLQHDVPAGLIGSNKENLNQTSLTIRMQQKIEYLYISPRSNLQTHDMRGYEI